MTWRGGTVALVVLAGGALGGCASYLAAGSAQTLEPGHGQFIVLPKTNYLVLPTIEAGGRYGLAKGIEIGGRLRPTAAVRGLGTAPPIGGSVELKTQLFRSSGSSRPVAVALMPSLAFDQVLDVGLWTSHRYFYMFGGDLPLLLGFGVLRHHEVVLAPRLGVRRFQEINYSARAWALTAGGSFGLLLRATDRLHLMPEVGGGFPVANLGGNMRSYDVPFVSAMNAELGFSFLVNL